MIASFISTLVVMFYRNIMVPELAKVIIMVTAGVHVAITDPSHPDVSRDVFEGCIVLVQEIQGVPFEELMMFDN